MQTGMPASTAFGHSGGARGSGSRSPSVAVDVISSLESMLSYWVAKKRGVAGRSGRVARPRRKVVPGCLNTCRSIFVIPG